MRRKHLYPANPQGWREGLALDRARSRRATVVALAWLFAGLLITLGGLAILYAIAK